jgi:hypothetical protein
MSRQYWGLRIALKIIVGWLVIRRVLGIQRRYEERSAVVTARLLSLLERLRDRLSHEDYAWAAENAEQSEWELAIATVHGAVARGDLALTADEHRELSEIERQWPVNRRLIKRSV